MYGCTALQIVSSVQEYAHNYIEYPRLGTWHQVPTNTGNTTGTPYAHACWSHVSHFVATCVVLETPSQVAVTKECPPSHYHPRHMQGIHLFSCPRSSRWRPGPRMHRKLQAHPPCDTTRSRDATGCSAAHCGIIRVHSMCAHHRISTLKLINSTRGYSMLHHWNAKRNPQGRLCPQHLELSMAHCKSLK